LEFNGKYRDFYISGNISLPEPRTISKGPLASMRENSGYVPFGNSMIQSPLLRGSMNYATSPSQCYERSFCNGLYISDGDINHADHSASLYIQISIKVLSGILSLSGERVIPLQERLDKSKNPVKNIKYNSENNRLTEYTLSLQPFDRTTYQFQIEYSRLYRKDSLEKKESLAGESFHILFRTALI
jgi:hypothetical protein